MAIYLSAYLEPHKAIGPLVLGKKEGEKCSPNNLLQNETGMILFFLTPQTGPVHNDVSVMGWQIDWRPWH